jgi:predicted enzyme related to lactoylglutathione lyase
MTMSDGNVCYFEIQADDPLALAAFYGEVFGWRFHKQPGLPIDYWRIETNGIAGGLLRRPAPNPPVGCGTNAFVCSMQVDNFDSAAEAITRLGGSEALPKFAVPGRCWQGYFLDPAGNTFGVFQPDESAR